ncbi:MAG: type II toxin-antitoxin system RelE/ParE family toxin [Deltaproteobacteria bacterium]|nr:type II toxin-antitoxin system RelE/ParE family toxin [Deltaproteobacteria bacterium]
MPAKKRTKYRLRVPDEIADFIKNVHPELKRKIKSALRDILTDPYIGKSLRDNLKGLSSFRVSRFRIIYRISSKRIIELIAIGPRKTIYELTYRILKKEGKKKK